MGFFRIYDRKRKRFLENEMPIIEMDGRKHPNVKDFCKKYPNLVYCDIEGVVISSDGTCYILDECGNWACAQEDYEIVFGKERA